MAGDIYRWLYKNGYFKSKLQKEVVDTAVITEKEVQESPELKKKKEKIRKRNEELRKKSSQGLSLF
jgi:penicillin-binding protein 2